MRNEELLGMIGVGIATLSLIGFVILVQFLPEIQ